MIVVLAGTEEGRQMISLLQEADLPWTGCVVSDYGARLLQPWGGKKVRQGRLDREQLQELLQREGAHWLIDATHPYAGQASTNAMEAATLCSVGYLRLERPALEIPQEPLVIPVEDLEELARLFKPQQTAFSTLGSSQLPQLAVMARAAGARLVARILPDIGGLRACQEAGLAPADIVAMQGPFSRELNRQIFAHYRSELILTKESGDPGGFWSKVEAARDLQIPIAVWVRPRLAYPLVLPTAQAVLEHIRREAGRE